MVDSGFHFLEFSNVYNVPTTIKQTSVQTTHYNSLQLITRVLRLGHFRLMKIRLRWEEFAFRFP